jgi:drug/metabolite transporter (DMT)-like permease
MPTRRDATPASPYPLLTLTPFLWACNWIAGRGLHEDVPPLAMTFCRWFFALVILAPVRAAADRPGRCIAVATVALFSSVLAYIFWNRGVEQVGANVAGLFVHLMPVYGVVLAWLLLGERLLPFHLADIVPILTGIWLTSRRRAPVIVAVGTD